MIIKDVVSLAKYSELAGVATKDNIDAITAFINLGMIELYKKFPIKVEEHIVDLVEDTVYYEMPENFMYILSAYGEVPAVDKEKTLLLPINEEDCDYSIFFTDWNTVQIPSDISGDHVSIIYVAKPKPITAVQADDGITTLDLPDTLVDALLSYIGYRGHLGVKSDSQSENNAHWARFERNCKRAVDAGVAYPSDSLSMIKRISDRGFV